MKKFLSLLLRLLVSLSLIILVFSKLDLKSVLNFIKDSNILLLLFSLSLHFVGALLGSSRWKVLLNTYGIDISQRDLYKLYMIGSFFNAFLPTSVGGDAVRMVKVYSLTEKRAQAVTSVFIERFIGMLVLYIISFLTFIFYFGLKEHKEILFIIVFLLFSSIAFIIFIWAPIFKIFLKIIPWNLLKDKLEKVRNSIKLLSKERKGLLKVFLYTFLLQINVVFYFFVISLAIKIRFPILYFFILIPIILTLTMLPITIGGIGLREGGFVLLFTKFGVQPEKALTLSMLGYFISLIFAGLGGLVYIFEKKKDEKN